VASGWLLVVSGWLLVFGYDDNQMDPQRLTPETEKRIALLFSPDEQELVRSILLEECGTNIPGWQSADLERLRFAVLKLSKGKLDALQARVDAAKRDFRDVLVAAGFGEPDSYRRWRPGRKW
jgi:hypothetical protein